MKKYSFYYLLMIFACATFITSCSDDDDEEEQKDPKQEIINNTTPRIELGDTKIDLGDAQTWIHYSENEDKTHIGTNTTDGDYISIEYKGKPSTGVKTEDIKITFPSNTEGEKEIVYEGNQISGFEVLKVDMPSETTENSGKIWITATVDGKKLEFVMPFMQEGRW